MASLQDLGQRLDAEFRSAEGQVAAYQEAALRSYQQRQARYQKFPPLLENIRDLAKERLEAVVQKFPNFKVTRSESRYGREVRIHFASELASIKLKLGVCHDEDVQNVAIDYHLEILPIFIRYEPHSRFEQPLESFDLNAAANWLDDRLVAFVKTYLSLQFAANYQKGHLVTDPVAGFTFPESFAKATLEHQGRKYYFIGDETKRAFAADNKINV